MTYTCEHDDTSNLLTSIYLLQQVYYASCVSPDLFKNHYRRVIRDGPKQILYIKVREFNRYWIKYQYNLYHIVVKEYKVIFVETRCSCCSFLWNTIWLLFPAYHSKELALYDLNIIVSLFLLMQPGICIYEPYSSSVHDSLLKQMVMSLY